MKGYQFPVCARCTGFYISLILYFTYTYLFYVGYNNLLLIFAIIFLIPSILDGITQLLEMRESNNVLRFITGLLGGLGLGIIVKALKFYLYLNYRG